MNDFKNTLVLATGNKNKLREVKAVASENAYNILSPKEVEALLDLPAFLDPEETGNTYQENAYIKAKACFNWCKLPSIGDDSGLEISALNNAPGIYSARYAGIGASDHEKINKVLNEIELAKEIKPILDTSARFRCVLCLVSEKEEASYFEGILEGHVLDKPRGDRGFGYDPIILITELNRTLSEISFEELIKYGFRGKAMRSLIKSFD